LNDGVQTGNLLLSRWEKLPLMNWHQDESVKVKAFLDTLFDEHIEEELSVGFDLEETAAICSCRGDEVGTKVLRGPVHVGMIAEGRG
jgi:hypothetical protein